MIRITQGYSLAGRLDMSMFEDRKQLFVDMLGWDVPVVDGRFEIDAYDGGDAIYLAAADDVGAHVGSMRLLPTMHPHILGALFPALCDGGVPAGEAIFEITRLCLPSRLGAARRLVVRNRLISAMVDYARRVGISALTGVVSSDFRAQVLCMGWRCAALGEPMIIGGQRLGAFRIDIDRNTPALLAVTGIYTPGTIAAHDARPASTRRARSLRTMRAKRLEAAMTQDSTLLTARLLADGYCVVREVVPAETIAALDRDLEPRFAATPFCEGGFYGPRTKRIGALLRRSRHAAALVRHRLILDIVEAVLSPWCQRITLNLSQAVELHPQALAQYPHRDEDLYGGPKGEVEYQVNVIWPVTPFTADNGATLLWPGSNRIGARAESANDPGIAAEMAPGDALLWLGSTLHGGGANLTDGVRCGVIISYCLGWLRTFENQYLVYPPEVARGFDPELAALIGYAQHLPNLGNVEGQCPSILLRDSNLDGLAAIDALRPEQATDLARYVAEQEAARAGLIGG